MTGRKRGKSWESDWDELDEREKCRKLKSEPDHNNMEEKNSPQIMHGHFM